MKAKTVYAYDPNSLELIREFSSGREAEKALGMSRGRVSEAIVDRRRTPLHGYMWSYEKMEKFSLNGSSVTFSSKPSSSKALGISVDEFRKKHDVNLIVQSTLEKLEINRIYEKDELTRMTGLRKGYQGLSQALEDATLYKGRRDGKSYWGHPMTIQQLKDDALLM